jgi:nucleotide-binding universal stress UspA family protein
LTGESNLRVLVGFDGSRASRRAVSTMAACFNVDEAEITLFHVKETPWIHLGLDREWFDYPGGMLEESNPENQLGEGLQREAEDLLEDARDRLAKYNYSVITMIEEGNPATEIVGEAENGEYDLIILGATGLRDAKHIMLGSVSAKVAWQAPCSVAVIKYNE